MREHKYRAWDKKTKTLWYPDMGDSWKFFANGTWHLINQVYETRIVLRSKDCIMMDFIGILSKYENKIYESDMLRFEDDSEDDRLFEVIYTDDGFRMKHIDRMMFISNYQNYLSIAGNIYENPELKPPK